MNISWNFDSTASRSMLKEIMLKIQRVFSQIPHDSSQLDSGSVFLRVRGYREHGVSYFVAIHGARSGNFTIHIERPDPIMINITEFIRKKAPSFSPEYEYHSREQTWAMEIINKLEASPTTNQVATRSDATPSRLGNKK